MLTRWLPAPDRRFRLDPVVTIRLVVVNLLADLSPLQQQVLNLLGVPETAYTTT